ncbi:MAG: DUF3160 domain-containing protein [Candidatus Riflebacteria bacterium]|nr:DUF3160 domain-containing protein [Candidatus Riflebacteria bacterium]
MRNILRKSRCLSLFAGLLVCGLTSAAPADNSNQAGNIMEGKHIIARSAQPIVDPAFSRDGKRLTWVEGSEGARRLFLADIENPVPKQLTEKPADRRSPSFSFDGKTVFFAEKASDNFDLFALDLGTGKTHALTNTPEDEFAVICAPGLFSEENEIPAKNSYGKLFFLKGKSGSGELFSMRDDGASAARLLEGAFTGFDLGEELANLLLTDSKGVSTAEFLPLIDGRMIAVETPQYPVFATSAAGLTDAVFTGNGVHAVGRKNESLILFNPYTSETRVLAEGVTSHAAADPTGKLLAWVRLDKNGEYQLVAEPVPDMILRVTNLYKWVDRHFDRLSEGRNALPVGTAEMKMLEKQHFCVTPDSAKLFHIPYEDDRYRWRERYITADAVLYIFHLFYDFALREIEKSHFRDSMFEIAAAMEKEAQKAETAAKKTDAKAIFTTWRVFFAVAAALSESDAENAKKRLTGLTTSMKKAACEDVDAIFAASGADTSAVLKRTTHFDQFKVRGHYSGAKKLESYFRLMMWLSQVPLDVFDHETNRVGEKAGKGDKNEFKNPATTKSARAGFEKSSADLSAILALYHLGLKAQIGTDTALTALEKVSSPLNYLVGETEDIGVIDLERLLTGRTTLANPDDVTNPEIIKTAFDALKVFPKPRIRPFEDLKVMFFPQRFTIDSYIMQRLVYKAIGTDDQPRMLPNMLDVPAALGSERAERLLLDVCNEGRYAKYAETLKAVRSEMIGLPATEWDRNMYRGWLKSLTDLCATTGASLPEFTKSAAWADRLLNTTLGSLATLRHDTLLYNKMGGAEAGEGGEEYFIRDFPGVYVDPYPEMFGQLRRMTLELYGRMTAQGLLPTGDTIAGQEESYDKILKLNAKGLTLKLISLFELLETASKKQLAGQELTPDERSELLGFGATIEHLSIALMRPDEHYYNTIDEEASLIADVFTGSETCLEMAIGRVFNLWVLLGGPGGEKLYRGGVFSYFEFEQPISKRLNDLEWKKMIRENKVPNLPKWTKSFIVGDLPRLSEKETEEDNGSPIEGQNDSKEAGETKINDHKDIKDAGDSEITDQKDSEEAGDNETDDQTEK